MTNYKENLDKLNIKNKMFKVKSLLLSCYGEKENKFVFDIFYLNKNGEFVDIEGNKKLWLNGKSLNKEDYIKSLAIDDYCKYSDYLQDYHSSTAKPNIDSISSTYKIKVDKNDYYLEEIDPADIKDNDFCFAPLFLFDTENRKFTPRDIGWPFFIIEATMEQHKRIDNFLKSIKFDNDKIHFEDIIATKKLLNKIAKEYYDSLI